MNTSPTHIIATLLALASPALAQLGSLAPPPGAVTETMLPLDTVEPRTPVGPDTTPGDANNIHIIDQPGSYFLTGDVVGEVGKNGIRITSPDVTLDLNGFSVRAEAADAGTPVNLGAPAMRDGARGLDTVEGTLTGIQLPNFVENVNIRNGSVHGWAEDGIAFLSDAGRISDVVAYANGRWGINCNASFAGRVSDCRLYLNGTEPVDVVRGEPGIDPGGGLNAGRGMLVTGCTAQNCVTGFLLNLPGAKLLDCVAVNCDGAGIRINAQHALVERCSVTRDVVGDGALFELTANASNTRVSECSVSGVSGGEAMEFATVILINGGSNVIVERSSVTASGVAVIVTGEDVTLKGNTLRGGNSTTIFGDPAALRMLIDSNVIDHTNVSTGVIINQGSDTTVIRNVFRGPNLFLTSQTGNNVAPVVSASDTDGSPFSNFAY